MAIEVNEVHQLVLRTTDASNYLTVILDKVASDPFYVVVQTEQFSKLVLNLRTETVALELKDDVLEVSAGGSNYKIELPLDEEGQLIKFPVPKFDFENATKTDINLSTIHTILTTAKSALATSLDVPCYTGYYLGESVVATDTFKICGMGIKLFDKPVLISSEMMNLLDTITDEKIEAFRKDNELCFVTPAITIIGKELEGIDEYAIEPITGLLESEFTSSCSVPKNELLQALDRLSLFVGQYDKNGIYLTFTRTGLMLTSKKSNGNEVIEYTSSENFKDYTCCIDIEMFKSQIKAHVSDAAIKIYYGLDNCIKMTEGNVTQIIALIEDDRA